MKQTYSQYIQYVKLMLGDISKNDKDSSLEFLNDDLRNYVDIAFQEILPYISVRSRATFPWNHGFNGAIKLDDFDTRAKSVTAVKRGSAQGYLQGGTTLLGSWSSYSVTTDGAYPNIPLYTAGGSLYSLNNGNISVDPWLLEKIMLKGINESAGDGHFLFDYGTQLLFINFNTATPTSVTIDYIPEYRTVEDITDSYWIMLIKKKALAVTKLALSQYRGKYQQVSGIPFQLDYNRLQREGEEETQRLNEIFEENLLNYRFD